MKGEYLTKGEILIRLREMFELVKLDAKLTQEQADLMDYNFAAIKFFVELQECRDFTEVRPLGFGSGEEEEGGEEIEIEFELEAKEGEEG